ncbi:MAG: NAD-dependent epimerase/dehydratase family protein [Flavobacteriales bacterium]
MKNKKVLLVGGGGYIGTALSSACGAQGAQVLATRRSAADDCVVLDFSKEETYANVLSEKYDLVIVLASAINGLNSIALTNDIFRENVSDYARFLQAMVEAKTTEKIVYFSSMTVYDGHGGSSSEEVATNPIHAYGLSKAMAEELTRFACYNNALKGMVLRIPGVYGGARKGGLIYNIALKAKSGEKIQLNTKGLGYWETVLLDDLTAMIMEVLEKHSWTSACEVYNLGYGAATDVIDTAKYIVNYFSSASELMIDGKNYNDFFLDTTKFRRLSAQQFSFKNSLDSYLASLR